MWFKIRNWAPSAGSVFDEDTGNSSAKVAILGATVAKQLFASANPIGETVRMDLTVCGGFPCFLPVPSIH